MKQVCYVRKRLRTCEYYDKNVCLPIDQTSGTTLLRGRIYNFNHLSRDLSLTFFYLWNGSYF